jgi:hypothetical protein
MVMLPGKNGNTFTPHFKETQTSFLGIKQLSAVLCLVSYFNTVREIFKMELGAIMRKTSVLHRQNGL